MEALLATPLKKIEHPKGDIYHAMRINDCGYAGFGEAYFTTIHYREFKGWKKHKKMTMNLVVPTGLVEFFIYDEETKILKNYEVGDQNYIRLTVPPGYWVSFCGLGENLNLILNLASETHDPNEAENLPLETFPIKNL